MSWRSAALHRPPIGCSGTSLGRSSSTPDRTNGGRLEAALRRRSRRVGRSCFVIISERRAERQLRETSTDVPRSATRAPALSCPARG